MVRQNITGVYQRLKAITLLELDTATAIKGLFIKHTKIKDISDVEIVFSIWWSRVYESGDHMKLCRLAALRKNYSSLASAKKLNI